MTEGNGALSIEWTPYAELHLLNALSGLKATGLNHHFCMAHVWQRFTSSMHVLVSPDTLREHLNTFYNFEEAKNILDEPPFVKDVEDFVLPPEDFPEAKFTKEEETKIAKKKNSVLSTPAHKQRKEEAKKYTAVLKKEETKKRHLPDRRESSSSNSSKEVKKEKKLEKKEKTKNEIPKRSGAKEDKKGHQTKKRILRNSDGKSSPAPAAKRVRH